MSTSIVTSIRPRDTPVEAKTRRPLTEGSRRDRYRQKWLIAQDLALAKDIPLGVALEKVRNYTRDYNPDRVQTLIRKIGKSVQDRIVYNKQQARIAQEEKGGVVKPLIVTVLDNGRTVPTPAVQETSISHLPLAMNMRREHEWIHVYDQPTTQDVRQRDMYNRFERVCRFCKIHHREHRQECILREVVKPVHRLPETYPSD